MCSLDPCLSRDPVTGSCHGCYRISHRQPDTHATSRQQTAGLLSDRSSTQFVIRPTVKLAPITRGALFWCQSCFRTYDYILQPVPPEIQLFSSLTAPHASQSRDAGFRLQCQGEVMKQIRFTALHASRVSIVLAALWPCPLRFPSLFAPPHQSTHPPCWRWTNSTRSRSTSQSCSVMWCVLER